MLSPVTRSNDIESWNLWEHLMKLREPKRRRRPRRQADQDYWRLIILGALAVGILLMLLAFIVGPRLAAGYRLVSEFAEIIRRAIGKS